ncbi:amidohydrolase family protein [uncultured Mailhella sp.]|uniref:amidohydrolase family protein n=1 Tax=uncultured Mailhella sp. TaxID=1981031 RepID=UPI0026050CA5|nr:amidohydrolase family protein [uncultured Mailhella sp.]
MIVDFRLRPPFKGFRNLSIFNPVCNSAGPMALRGSYLPSAHEKSMELFFQEMKKAGVEKGVVMARNIGDKASSVPNEDVKELAELYPDEIIPFGGIDLSSGIFAAVKELEKCIRYGFRGVALEPGWNDPPRLPDDAVYYPIYSLCEQAALPIVLTVSLYQGPTLEYSNPVHIQNIANDFPRLQIVIAHACYPWIPQIFNVAMMHHNIWLIPDLYMHNPWTPGREMYINGCRWMNCDRIIFGSAYPCYGIQDAVVDLKSYNFTKQEEDKILYKNAYKLLGIKQ